MRKLPSLQRLLAVALASVLLASLARADSIRTKVEVYEGVKIASVRDGWILFRVGQGKLKAVRVGAVTRLSVEGNESLNRSEQLLSARKYDQVVTFYDQLLKDADGWQANLLRYRRLMALSAAGRCGDAVETWLDLIDKAEDRAEVLQLRPRRLEEKGSIQNARAIELLAAKLDSIKGDRVYTKAVRALLITLLRREGRAADAGRVAAGRAMASRRAPKQFRSLEGMIDRGKANLALVTLQKNLRAGRYTEADLPYAFYYAGEARRKLAADADADADAEKRRRLLLSAGLDYMRVAACFASHPPAAESLRRAGDVHVSLGNVRSARLAYQAVTRRYPNSDAARKAKASVKAMQQAGQVQPGQNK